MKLKTIKKGEYGYIGFQKKKVLIITILLFLIALGIYFFGLKTYGNNKNLFTIIAVLGLLPACKSFVSLIMFFKAKSVSEDTYKKISSVCNAEEGLYELEMTSEKKSFSISHLYIANNLILGYSENEKIDVNEWEEFVTQILKLNQIKNVTVKLYKDINKYTARIAEHKNNIEADLETITVKHNELISLMKDISL